MPPPKPRRRESVLKRSVYLDGHKTSVTLEDAFWGAFKGIAAAQGTTIGRLIATIDNEYHERPPAASPNLLVGAEWRGRLL